MNGDKVDFENELDTKPREVTVPPDLQKALKRDKLARERFESLPYSHKRQHVEAIEDAKKPETRRRRIEKALEMLRDDA